MTPYVERASPEGLEQEKAMREGKDFLSTVCEGCRSKR